MTTDKLSIIPISQKEANAFVSQTHRHHGPVRGSIFQLACAADSRVVGVVIVGRPVARVEDTGWTLEVNRLATDGTKNACSMLYGAAWRVARELGYKRLITYILQSEPGTTLYAAGWKCIGEAGGGTWNRKGRPRVDTHPTQRKLKFMISNYPAG